MRIILSGKPCFAEAWLSELAPGGGDSGEIGRVPFGTRGIVVKRLAKHLEGGIEFLPDLSNGDTIVKDP